MSFENIKSQESNAAALKDSIRSGRVFSSYLFLGPSGVGKKSFAVEFAKALNCSGTGEIPCDSCASCVKIDSKNHPDVFIVEPGGASSSIGVPEIRGVITKASLKPYEAEKKVFIINNADLMNEEASNAFLKTLEEPPSRTVFVLVSRSREALLATIVSRCHVIDFFPAPKALVEKALRDKFDLKPEEAWILGNFASGRIGEAVRMKESSFLERKNALLESMKTEDGSFAREISAFSGRGELKEKIDFIISYLRDIFLYNISGSDAFVFNIDRLDDIKETGALFTADELEEAIGKLITLRSYVDYNANPKIITDVLSNMIRRFYARGSAGKAA